MNPLTEHGEIDAQEIAGNSTGLEISQQFVSDALLPVLRTSLPKVYDRLAVAIVGTGSDVLGWDDEISRDHHWGPRANVMYLREDAGRVQPQLQQVLATQLPDKYEGFEVRVNIGNLTGVCSCAMEDFFARFLGREGLPESDVEWVRLCEVDLFHVTAGKVVYDGPGKLTEWRSHLAYYPDNVWKKRLADWCMYVTGREAPYNLHRVSKREDDLTCMIYFGLCLKRLMELAFALNRQYAPYTKWLNRTFRMLPRFGADLAPLIDDAMAARSWNKRVRILVDANYVVAEALSELGFTAQPQRRAFDDSLTDLSLYDSAAQIYSSLPEELFQPSFNQIELWERMAREVLFDTNDYFHHVNNKSH